MNTYKVYWQLWYDWEFRQGKLFEAMLNTVEDSPYHRELNTGVHTNMVIAEYSKLAPEIWSRQTLLGAIACAYHDVGKPQMEQIIEKDGETRKRYLGHELVSARLFVNDATSTNILSSFELSSEEIYMISWMIEYHVPWNLGDDKLKNVLTTAVKLGILNTFLRVLKSDQFGRTSDPEIQDKQNIDPWIEKFTNLDTIELNPELSHRSVVFMIGPSGSGKSTAAAESALEVFSLDSLRHEFYDMNDYKNAFKMSVEDDKFNVKTNKRFLSMLKIAKNDNTGLVIDNINISKKSRRMYLTQSKNHGFRTVGIVFFGGLEKTISRANRPDKTIPSDVVKRQYMNLQLPQYGEFDQVIVISL